MKVALIGCGFIGTSLAEFIEQEMKGSMELVAVYDEVKERATSLCRKLGIEPRIAENSDDIIHDSTVNLVIEAASQKAAKAIIPKALTTGKHVMIMSVGALADSKFYEEVEKMLRKSEAKICVPSGAIGGLDWIKAASTVGLQRVIITSRKPPKALEGAPYVVRNKIDLRAIEKPTQIYEGPASDAAASFPANVNVAAALSLAGIGSQKTLVRVIVDPTVERNIHEISAEGAAGRITVRVENLPSPTNPKTSWIAALSAMQKLREMSQSISVGT
jgi:aspartate dehydrogenase